MSTVVTLIAVFALTVLVLVSLKRQLEARSAQRQAEAGRQTPAARAQREESQQRRSAVRAAHAERVRKGTANADEQGQPTD